MPDLSELLRSTNADEIEDPIIPEGWWDGVIKSGRLDDKDKEGNARVSQNSGVEFAQFVVMVQCLNPVDGVDPNEAEKYLERGWASQTLARHSEYVPIDEWSSRTRRFTKKLEKCGALTAHRPIDQILEGLKDSDVPVRVLIEHREFNDEPVADARKLVPQS